MVYWILACLSAFLLDMVMTVCREQTDKNLEIVALRKQVRILERKLVSKPRIKRAEKLFLATVADKLRKVGKGGKERRGSSILIFKPDTALKWHRELVRRKWAYRQERNRGGWPKIDAEIEQLILDLAEENPRCVPLGTGPSLIGGSMHRRDVLGGIVHSYYRQAP